MNAKNSTVKALRFACNVQLLLQGLILGLLYITAQITNVT